MCKMLLCCVSNLDALYVAYHDEHELTSWPSAFISPDGFTHVHNDAEGLRCSIRKWEDVDVEKFWRGVASLFINEDEARYAVIQPVLLGVGRVKSIRYTYEEGGNESGVGGQE